MGRARSRNQDALLISPPDDRRGALRLLGVADGVGGRPAGHVASRLALSALDEALSGWAPREDPLAAGWRPGFEGRLRRAVRHAHRVVCNRGRTNPGRDGMATTLVAAAFARGWVGIAWVGDSRAYLVRDGRLSRLTRDHALDLRPGLSPPGRPASRAITRAVGVEGASEADVEWVRLRGEDVVLLATDGVTRYLDGEPLLARIRGSASLEAAAAGLIQDAMSAGGRDDATVVLARFERRGGPPRPAEGGPAGRATPSASPPGDGG